MITRELRTGDLTVISALSGVSRNVLETVLKNALTTIVVEDNGVKGFVIVRRLAGINELTHWHLRPEHSLILKSIIRRAGEPLAVIEKEGDEERIGMLEDYGFKKICKKEGIFPDSKAVILRLG
ncbi:hypothetical protein GF352_04660 [archaeon]|nr:hypothetical protein [archaeon]